MFSTATSARLKAFLFLGVNHLCMKWGWVMSLKINPANHLFHTAHNWLLLF